MASEVHPMMVNDTAIKFGHPETLIRSYDHWLVLLRPAQVTLGSLVLVSASEATAYSQLPEAAFAEQHRVIGEIERALQRLCDYQRINYLMLMMVDCHVHFHVIPRYSGTRRSGSIELADTGWPGPPDLGQATTLAGGTLAALRDSIRSEFN